MAVTFKDHLSSDLPARFVSRENPFGNKFRRHYRVVSSKKSPSTTTRESHGITCFAKRAGGSGVAFRSHKMLVSAFQGYSNIFYFGSCVDGFNGGVRETNEIILLASRTT